ncbi:MAG: VWA domain-containing protein [Deltaproteobacteria bacterium]|nr:VWA domain-containing protein [Deltaproteobacteria bacterium]
MKRKKGRSGWLNIGGLVAVLGAAAGCAMSGMGGSDFGATQGGVQDLALAREYVAAGTVPPPEAFPVEGIFSEHDLPLQGTPCQTLLCLRTALGLAPTAAGESAAWLQVGMSSTIDPETWERPAQTLIFTVDVSGSMGWDYKEVGEYPSPGALSRLLMKEIVSRLDANDRVAIVTYGSTSRLRLSPTEATSGAVTREIDALSSGGSTNMEAGLERAIAVARDLQGASNVRIMLFTDVRPNVGATEASEFEGLVAEAAALGAGTTVFGLGAGLGPETFEAMSHLRGGNAFALFDQEDLTDLMEESWPWMLTPIAYDLELSLGASQGFQVTEAYGFPAPEVGAATAPQLNAASVFLSRKRGAMLVQLQPLTSAATHVLTGLEIAGQLRYETPEGHRVEQPVLQRVTGEEPRDAAGHYFEQASVGKTVALALLCEGMQEATRQYAADPAAAIAVLQAALDRYRADIEVYEDASLQAEVEFASALLTLLEEGAPQTDLYGR